MDFKTISLTGLISALVGLSSAYFGYTAYERDNKREATSIEASITENRVRIEEISQLRDKVDRIPELQSDLKVLQNQLRSNVSESDMRTLKSQIAELQKRFEALESRPSTSGSVSPKQVAAILAQDYADILRGPKGEKGAVGPEGPQGPVGPAGEGPSAAVVQDKGVRNLMTFTSDYGSRQIGPFKIDLQGCRNNGGSVTCKFALLNTGSERNRFYFEGRGHHIALANGEWVRSKNIRLLKYSASGYNDIDYTAIPDLPTSFEIDFPGAQTDDVGLPVVKLNIAIPDGAVEWLRVKFSDG